jgi:non-heme Fe2+,alpha-ketoglutarate-dependent halogenase
MPSPVIPPMLAPMTSIATDTRRQAEFIPADPALARTLRPAQVQAFNRDGIIGPFDVHTAEEALANRAAFDAMLAAFRAQGKDSYAINGFHDRCATIWDLAVNPRILDLVQDLIGPDIVVWGSHFFCKMPGDGKAVAWHQDATYWPLTPTRTVTAWIAIDDADLGNGAMQFIPGSHLYGALPVRPSTPQDNNVLWEQSDGWERFGAPASVAWRAGQCTLHSDLLLHGSQPNESDRRRCGLTVRYAAAEVRSWAGWNNTAILCRGEDRDGHWKHHPRPDGDRPFGDPIMFGSN